MGTLLFICTRRAFGGDEAYAFPAILSRRMTRNALLVGFIFKPNSSKFHVRGVALRRCFVLLFPVRLTVAYSLPY